MNRPELTAHYISESFGPATVTAGRALCEQGSVLDWSFNIEGTKVLGRVQNPRRAAPYQVELNLYDRNESGETYLSGQCSCPAKHDCPHAAALALMLLQDLRDSKEKLKDYAAPESELEDHDNQYPSFGATWLVRLASTLSTGATADSADECIVYLLSADRKFSEPFLQVEPHIVRRLKSGGFGTNRPYNWRQLACGQARYIQASDRSIAKLWVANSPKDYHISPSRPLLPPDDADVLNLLMTRIIRTGRAFWESQLNSPLQLGPAVDGKIEWIVSQDARQSPQVVLNEPQINEPQIKVPQIKVFYGSSPWYINVTTGHAGTINLPFSTETYQALRDAPRLSPQEAAPIRQALEQLGDHLPLPQLEVAEEVRADPPVPCLHLKYQKYPNKVLTSAGRIVEGENAAVLSFDYGFDSAKLDRSWQSYRWVDGKTTIITKRCLKFENEIELRLLELSLLRTGHVRMPSSQSCWVQRSRAEESWLPFVQESLPLLKQQGFRITTDPSFQFQVVQATDQELLLNVDETSSFWFSLDLGIEVDGERICLLPVLMDALAKIEPSSLASVDQLNKQGKFYARLDDGRIIAIPFERVRAILSCLLELLSKNAHLTKGRLKISLAHVMALLESERLAGFKWHGAESLRCLAAEIKNFDIHQPIEEPEGFLASLRPYQKEGLRWLEFISTLKLGGILADDMGLGKTVQTLAHILRQKQQGKLDHPCLVLCPTSVLPNWIAEAQRLAPDLKVLSLHGSDRASRFAEIASADLVLSTYPLLVRDADKFVATKYDAVILDEAQAIKNHTTKVAQTVLQLDARYRLCLTGTPIENHLGELWSQFNFLMPGFLGDRKTFEHVFQTPIEENNDPQRLQLLFSRLNSFILRRTKEQVAQDLPSKTIMIKHVELEGKQRDLYETVRLSMSEQVLAQVKARGLASSQLIILDAIMKLRQVCCDPRLVKLPAAADVQESAKLEYLSGMLNELIEENRRVLIFSQFTSMLDLIAAQLRQQNIPFVTLRGDTKDRVTPVREFQSGKIPVFLISLKAGGTGLNLTAADTVIHYDPWWNPAVEEQATDRAHRIGQDKPVFVYRLVAAGTIEQLILELQERKRKLAESLLNHDGIADGALHFDGTDLESFFAPLPDASNAGIGSGLSITMAPETADDPQSAKRAFESIT